MRSVAVKQRMNSIGRRPPPLTVGSVTIARPVSFIVFYLTSANGTMVGWSSSIEKGRSI